MPDEEQRPSEPRRPAPAREAGVPRYLNIGWSKTAEPAEGLKDSYAVIDRLRMDGAPHSVILFPIHDPGNDDRQRLRLKD